MNGIDYSELSKIKEDTEYISNKADEGINYAEKKTNKFFNIIRKFINKIKSIFIN